MPVFLWSLCLLLPCFSINNKLSKAIIVNDGHRVWAYVCLNVPQNSTELPICPWYNKEECLLSVFSKGPVLNVTIIMKTATQSVLNMKSKLKRNQLRFLLQIKFYGIVAHFFLIFCFLYSSRPSVWSAGEVSEAPYRFHQSATAGAGEPV